MEELHASASKSFCAWATADRLGPASTPGPTMIYFLLTLLLLAVLLGVSALRTLLWWATVVLPLAAWLLWMSWRDSTFAWWMLVVGLQTAAIAAHLVREDAQREREGKPPLTREEIRRRMRGA